MREIALHLLDIAENSVAAGATSVEITVEEDLPQDRLRLTVQDDGRGMDESLLAQVMDPFVTSRTTRKVGLGLPLLKEAAEACGGSLRINSTPGQGTCLEVQFQRSHIDRAPLGDLAGTMLTLVVGCPQVHWMFHYRLFPAEGHELQEFIFDDAFIKQALEGISLTEPEVLRFVRSMLEEGVRQIQRTANFVAPTYSLVGNSLPARRN